MLHQLIKTSFYLLVFSGMLLFSCKNKKHVASKNTVVVQNTNKYKDYKKGTVTKFDVDGCSFIITIQDENQSDPTIPEDRLIAVNLEDQYKQDGLKIWIMYVPEKQESLSTCMAGEIVRITAIEKR